MTREPSEPKEISVLFEQSAAPLDPVARGRLLARAREIPERRRAFLVLPRWAWAAGFSAVTAAGTVALVSWRAPPAPRPIALLSAAPPANEARAPAATAAEVAPSGEVELATALEPTDADEFARGNDVEDATSPDVLDDLALDPGDLADSDVDAWISAASATLGG